MLFCDTLFMSFCDVLFCIDICSFISLCNMFIMLCCYIFFRVILYQDVLPCAIFYPFYDMLCLLVVFCYTNCDLLLSVLLLYIDVCCFVLFCTVLYYFVMSCIILYYNVLCCDILCISMLYFIDIRYFMPFYDILYHIALSYVAPGM